MLEHHQQTQGLLWSLYEIQLAARKVSALREGCYWDRSEVHQQGFQAVAGPSYPSYRIRAVEVLELFPGFPSTACVVHVVGLEKAGFAGTAG